MIEFHKTADATARVKKLCRETGVAVRAVNSRWIADKAQFRTTVLPQEQSYEATARIVAVLRENGFHDIVTSRRPLDVVTAFSALAGTTGDPVAELARRALVELVPESWSADEVSAMDDNEAIATAVGAGVLEG